VIDGLPTGVQWLLNLEAARLEIHLKNGDIVATLIVTVELYVNSIIKSLENQCVFRF
jgi:hypothetical protein